MVQLSVYSNTTEIQNVVPIKAPKFTMQQFHHAPDGSFLLKSVLKLTKSSISIEPKFQFSISLVEHDIIS